jgi:cell division protein FtsN
VAARKGKSQARRNSGNDHGLPGWAWLVLGVVLAALVLLVAPKFLKDGKGDGFFRPTPNPDAQPASVPEDDVVAPAGDSRTSARGNADEAVTAPKDTKYDFYTLLPSDEVPMSDAELEATARAEAERAARPQPSPAGDVDDQPDAATPQPAADAAPATAATPTAAPAAGGNDTPYLLQAGAFGASGDAEALKARIALLGLSARVESAQIAGKTVYRVRMGPYGSASELADAKRKLATGGLPALAIKAK